MFIIQGNPLYTLIRENSAWFCQEKLELFSDDMVYCVDETGKRYNSLICYEMYDLYRRFNMEAKSYWDESVPCPYKDYADYVKKRFEPYMHNDNSETKRFKEALIRRLLKQETLETSSNSMQECSISDYGSYLKLTGPDFEFPGGFSSLIAFLASKIPKELIKLNHAVQAISLNTDYKTMNKDFDGLKVKCYNGQVFFCDHVIVTCSLNYLKKYHSTLFQPGLISQTKLDALNTLKMGVVNKLFLVYDDLDSFFPKDFNSVHPIFFNDESYDVVNEWYLKLFTFDKFYDNVLLVWITGEEAAHVETLSEEEIANILTKLLKKFLKNDRIPLPRKMIR